MSIVTGSGITDLFVGTTNTVHVQAVYTNGSNKITGGDVFYLCIDQPPTMMLMTDNGDGTYSADYTSLVEATIDVSVFLNQGCGLIAEYFTNKVWSGTPAITQVDENINFNWDNGNVGPLS